ncbi:hypothetical protein CTAYLR_006296 [Chrysophaeum taylorii]|uniref:PPM-type phosphatase domain-containing protein n=1 Tax=Chrysophaeum taylorii TaxID=2483200 RepID=A0AAD7UM78_9STRA|nr:hypothetical protein CTAYLR_006296 [Chrysophaeum taylorii]
MWVLSKLIKKALRHVLAAFAATTPPHMLGEEETRDSESSDDSRDEAEVKRDWTHPVRSATWWVAAGELHACEDRVISEELRIGPHVAHCAAAIDGHGGDACASWLRTHLARYVESRLDAETQRRRRRCRRRTAAEMARRAAERALRDADKGYRAACQREKNLSAKAGACVSLAVFFGGALAVANLGDARAFLVADDGTVTQLTTTHRATLAKEALRVRRAGGSITRDGRVARGVLEPTRTVGDFDIKRRYPRVVVADPDSVAITRRRRRSQRGTKPSSPYDSVALVLASDGVCDILPPNDIGRLVASRLGVARDTEIAKTLVDEAKRLGTLDDATAVVLEFWPLMTPAADHADIALVPQTTSS